MTLETRLRALEATTKAETPELSDADRERLCLELLEEDARLEATGEPDHDRVKARAALLRALLEKARERRDDEH